MENCNNIKEAKLMMRVCLFIGDDDNINLHKQ